MNEIIGFCVVVMFVALTVAMVGLVAAGLVLLYKEMKD